jgi:hypothetical protein
LEKTNIANRCHVGDSSLVNSNVRATGSKQISTLKRESDEDFPAPQADVGLIVTDDFPTSIPIMSRELDVIEMHLGSVLYKILTGDK